MLVGQNANPLGGLDACILIVAKIGTLAQHHVGLGSDLKVEAHNYLASLTARTFSEAGEKVGHLSNVGTEEQGKRTEGRNNEGSNTIMLSMSAALEFLMRYCLAFFLTAALTIGCPYAIALDAHTVNSAELSSDPGRGINPITVKAQVLLDRAHFSPGVIDGKDGDNFRLALQSFRITAGLEASDRLNAAVWSELNRRSPEAVLREYTISEKDVMGPFTENIPTKMEDMRTFRTLDTPALGNCWLKNFICRRSCWEF